MEQIISNAESRMQKTFQTMEYDYSMIRAGRANPNLLSKITVSYYGTQTPLQQVSNVSVPEARVIVIQPWEKSLLKEIEKAILASDIGITPNNDGQSIRLVFPELTKERREQLAKDIRKKAEEAKVAVRNIRRDANDSVKKMQKASEITEDDAKEGENRIQKMTDKAIKEIDEACEKKCKEIMTV